MVYVKNRNIKEPKMYNLFLMTADVWFALGEGNLPSVSIFYQK